MAGVDFLRHGYGRFDSRAAIGPVCWPHSDLLWIHSGRATLRIGNAPAERLQRGQGVLIHPNTPFQGHAVSSSARASIQHFYIHNDVDADTLPEPLQPHHNQPPGYTRYEAADADEFDEMIDEAMRLAMMPSSGMVYAMRLAQLTLILGKLALDKEMQPAQGPHHDRLAGLLRSIREHPDRRWTLQQMSEHTGMSASHFRAVFRVQLGVSPGQYQQHIRMTEAARLLYETDAPIKSIAARLGYFDLSHFYRQFQTIHAQTPAAYRDAMRPDA